MPLQPRIGFVLACIFLDALGIGLIVPVLPRLIGSLCDGRDAQTMWYGAIMLSYGLMQFASSPLLGSLSDRIGRRPVLLGGILGLGLMFAVPAFCDSLWLILASRIAGGMMSANTAVAQAYIADITSGIERSAAFGKIGAVFGIGFVLGPAIGGILGQSDPRMPFLFACAITLVNFLYGALVLPESLGSRSGAPVSIRNGNPFSSIARLVSVPQNRLAVSVLVLAWLANSIMQCTWALYTEYRYGFTPLQIGLSVFALGISISIVQGWALQKMLLAFAVRKIIVCVLATASLCMLGVGLSSSGAVAAALCCVYAIGGATAPLLTGTISSRTSCTEQGRTIGSVGSINSLTGAIAPAIGTPLMIFAQSHIDDALAGTPYFICAALTFVALILFLMDRDEE